MAFGPHLIIDGKNCNKRKLSSLPFVRKFLNNLTKEIKMTKISGPHVLKYKDKWAKTPGVTGVVVFAESHCSVHTFPDNDYVFLDVFSCKEFDTKKASDFIRREFNIKNMKIKVFKRGINFQK